MNKDSYLEKNISKNPALELFQAMGYTYISPQECEHERGSRYHVLLKNILREQLRKMNRFCYGGTEKEFSAATIQQAIHDLEIPLTDGLVHTSEKIYDALLLGKSYPELVGTGKPQSFNLKYIDWEHPENNVFHVTEEFMVESRDKLHNARPDIVLFINGIPFAVIECKAPDISVEQGIEQTVRNQQYEYIPHLYVFAQIVVSTNKNAVKYATCGTPKKFWSIWKEQDNAFLEQELARCVPNRTPTEQDSILISLFSPRRLLELTRYFVLFDANVKKICRYQQYFAVREIIKTISQRNSDGTRKGGVIWHTQGSGKSLTMVMIAKYLLLELADISPKVVVVTDRKELDRQITGTFTHTRLIPAQATSGANLVHLINEGRADIITTIINKFNAAERHEVKNTSADVFILIDESHRSNYGQLAAKMRKVFPRACYIGFTGTPLMKQEKNTLTKFGTLIHKYTIQDGVDDKAIVPLIYEGRFVEQHVDEANIDLWFEQTTKRLTEAQKNDLSRKWSSIRRLASTDARIKRIALDINNHFTESIKNTGFKAMLAVNYKKDAVRYLKCFEELGDLECAVVISAPDMREGVEDVHEGTDNQVVGFWNKMMERYGSADKYEEAVKDAFCAGDIDILIVCSKLLTGFDAPICQVLYIDKELKEHGLLQAIARTNRLCDGKDYGLIVDYRGLIENLDTAIDMYAGAGLENFDGGDLKGFVTDVVSAAGTLRQAYSRLIELFPDEDFNDTEKIEVSLAEEEKRKDFYNRLCAFGKALTMVLNSPAASEALPESELLRYRKAFAFFSKVRRSVKIRFADAVDNKEYEPLMQNLLDTHLSVAGLKQITAPVDILNHEAFEKELEELTSIRAKADAISNRLSKTISEKYEENPAYYGSFSKRIKEALDQYREKIISDAEYLEKLRTIVTDFRSGNSGITYPQSIQNNVHAQAFYGVLSEIFDGASEVRETGISYEATAKIAKDITKIIEDHSQVDWSENKTIHNRIAQDIDDYFYEYGKTHGIKFDLMTVDKVIDNVKTVAIRRFEQ